MIPLDRLAEVEKDRDENRDLVVIEHLERIKAERERDTARARLAEVERERDEARDTRDVTYGMLLQAREAGDAARAQVATLLDILRGVQRIYEWTDDGSCTREGCAVCRAVAALKAAGITPDEPTPRSTP